MLEFVIVLFWVLFSSGCCSCSMLSLIVKVKIFFTDFCDRRMRISLQNFPFSWFFFFRFRGKLTEKGRNGKLATLKFMTFWVWTVQCEFYVTLPFGKLYPLLNLKMTVRNTEKLRNVRTLFLIFFPLRWGGKEAKF